VPTVTQQHPVSLIFEESDVTFKATADVAGGHFVKPSGNRTGGGVETGLTDFLDNVYQCAHCGAGQVALGVAKYDVKSGEYGGVYGTPGRIVPVIVGTGGVTAGNKVMSDGTGQAVAWATAASEANEALGLALTTAAAGELAEIKLF
jgi:hypothetical protein